MTATTNELIHSRYNHFTAICKKYSNLFLQHIPQTIRRPINQTTNPQRHTIPTPISNLRRVKFLPFPTSQINATPKLSEQPNTPNLRMNEPYYPSLNPLSRRCNYTIDIDWETATILTEIKTPIQPFTLMQTNSPKRTDNMTEKHLPTWQMLLYIILYKLANGWNRANAETLLKRNLIIQWPTFRPLRIIKAITPIMSLLIVVLLSLYLPTTKQTSLSQIRPHKSK